MGKSNTRAACGHEVLRRRADDEGRRGMKGGGEEERRGGMLASTTARLAHVPARGSPQPGRRVTLGHSEVTLDKGKGLGAFLGRGRCL